MNAIEVEDLTKRFDNFTAVDHISFNIQQGELFGFLGPNGAGKTTSVRMITGVVKLDTGRASIMGYDVEREALKAKQATGVLPETSNAYIDLSAWQNLMLMGKLYGLAKNERQSRAEDLLKKFSLYDKKDVAVKGFSKGMKQRLQICMALISEPQVLILDEPTSGLDVQSSRLIRSIIADLNAQGVTFLLTTHNMEEANQLCSRIAIINRGKIVAIDRPEVLKKRIKSLHSVEVSFNRDVLHSDLSGLQGVESIERMGDKFRLYALEPAEVIYNLVDYARSEKIEIVSLATISPTLEDVFVKYTEGT
ncbi:MAG: ATP-binding cassette domain-containing protein [Methanotrichaceae archaeon]|nr:ATP-binding cassette domain-containing protein [Methanotrichaceae archaeon]